MTIRTDADIQRLREQGVRTTAEETLIETCRTASDNLSIWCGLQVFPDLVN